MRYGIGSETAYLRGSEFNVFVEILGSGCLKLGIDAVENGLALRLRENEILASDKGDQ